MTDTPIKDLGEAVQAAYELGEWARGQMKGYAPMSNPYTESPGRNPYAAQPYPGGQNKDLSKVPSRIADLETEVEGLRRELETARERIVELDVDKAAARNDANERVREVQRLKAEQREVARVLATAYPPDIIEEDGLAEAVRMALRSRAEARNRLEVLENAEQERAASARRGHSLALGEHTTQEILEELRARGETACNSAGLKMVEHCDKLLTRLPSAMLAYTTVGGRDGDVLAETDFAEEQPEMRAVNASDFESATAQAGELFKLGRYLDDNYPRLPEMSSSADRAIFALEVVRKELPSVLNTLWRQVVMPALKALNKAGVDVRVPEMRAPASSQEWGVFGTFGSMEDLDRLLPKDKRRVGMVVLVQSRQLAWTPNGWVPVQGASASAPYAQPDGTFSRYPA